MRYSEIALKVLAAKECGLIKTNAQFWSNFSDREEFIKAVLNNDRVLKTEDKISNELGLSDSQQGIICAYDSIFPFINRKVKNNGDKPFLIFYKGDISLLSNLNKNVAVVGLIDPDEEIVKRETDIIKRLVDKDLVIVSGLAIGCDTIAHKTCLENGGKTVAILPSQIDRIYPAENRDFSDEIVKKGGLLISEYYKDAGSRNEAINRFIARDRLQAMFAKAIILIASYRQGEGDSGSRHAMEAARKYEIDRYIVYNDNIDSENKQFGLNKDLISKNGLDHVKNLIPSSINIIQSLENANLYSKEDTNIGEQLKLL